MHGPSPPGTKPRAAHGLTYRFLEDTYATGFILTPRIMSPLPAQRGPAVGSRSQDRRSANGRGKRKVYAPAAGE